MRHVRALALALLVAACGSSNPRSVPVMHGPGERPEPEVAEHVVRAHLARMLKDPDSVKQFAITSPPTCTKWYRGTFGTGGMEAGWAVNFEYNAKNSYGGYVGLKSGQLIMRGAGVNFIPVIPPEPRQFFPCQ